MHGNLVPEHLKIVALGASIVAGGCGDATATHGAGDEILFSGRIGTAHDVYLVSLDDGVTTNLTSDGVSVDGAWSPDGSRIAFSSRRDLPGTGGSGQIFVMDATGANVSNLSGGPTHDGDTQPLWSPDGSLIAFARGDATYVMTVVGTDLRPLGAELGPVDSPAWSPDGSRLAVVSRRDGNPEIYVIDADGRHPVNTTNDAAPDRSPTWSPDGSRIAFESLRSGQSDIYVMDADGSDVVRLTAHEATDFLPRWSPTSQWIAFTSLRDGNVELYAVAADGSGVRNLSLHRAVDGDLAWTPDGVHITFTSDRSGSLEVHVLDVDGSGVELVTAFPGFVAEPRWRPAAR
jgi:Tol biopolymer transport system component